MENTSAFINRDEKIKILPLYITETLDETLPSNKQLRCHPPGMPLYAVPRARSIWKMMKNV